MLLKQHTILDDFAHSGQYFHFMGANAKEKTFRLMDESGTNYLIKCHVEKNRYTRFELLPEDAPVPHGCRGDESYGPVRLVPYDREDQTSARSFKTELTIYIGEDSGPSAPSVLSIPAWNKGYRVMDMRAGGTGHTWLWIGHHNYKSLGKCRAVFQYAVIEDDEEEDDNGE